MKNNRNILIPLKNNFDYFSRNSLTVEIVCQKTKNGSENGNDIHNSNAANIMALELHKRNGINKVLLSSMESETI